MDMTLDQYLEVSTVRFDKDNLMTAVRAVIALNPHCRGADPERLAFWVIEQTNVHLAHPSYWECRGFHVSTFYMEGETYPLRAKVAVMAYTAELYHIHKLAKELV